MNVLDQAKQLQNRTKKFAVRIIKSFARLPKDEAARIIGRQFLRSGTSLAANYRAACRALKRQTNTFLDRIADRSRTGANEVARAVAERM
jgi:four helix bundle protein